MLPSQLGVVGMEVGAIFSLSVSTIESNMGLVLFLDVEKKVQQVLSSFKPRLHMPWPDLYQNESSPERKYLPEVKFEWGDSPSLRSPLKPAEDDPILDDQDDWLQLALKQSPAISWRRPPL
ncbi:hypothetical protein EJ110_NYTH29465 [Nymphaea thermarum]|nr:hypothetical protein EJ110_NYTH29465 [Nymphaea thermarum]